MSGKAMTQHVGSYHSESSTPADLLHDSCQGAARQRPIRFDADQINLLQETPEFGLCCLIRSVLRIAKPFAVMESVGTVIAPMSNPGFFCSTRYVLSAAE